MNIGLTRLVALNSELAALQKQRASETVQRDVLRTIVQGLQGQMGQQMYILHVQNSTNEIARLGNEINRVNRLITEATNLAEACKAGITVAPDPAAQLGYVAPDIDYVDVGRFCRQHDKQPLNYRLLFNKLITYGRAQDMSHEQYKVALTHIFPMKQAEQLKILYNDNLQSIFDHFLAEQPPSITPQSAEEEMQKFTRKPLEPIAATMNEYKVLQRSAATLYPTAPLVAGQPVPNQDNVLIPTLLRNVGVNTRKTLLDYKNTQSTLQGYTVTFDELLQLATNTEQNNGDFHPTLGWIGNEYQPTPRGLGISMHINAIDMPHIQTMGTTAPKTHYQRQPSPYRSPSLHDSMRGANRDNTQQRRSEQRSQNVDRFRNSSPSPTRDSPSPTQQSRGRDATRRSQTAQMPVQPMQQPIQQIPIQISQPAPQSIANVVTQPMQTQLPQPQLVPQPVRALTPNTELMQSANAALSNLIQPQVTAAAQLAQTLQNFKQQQVLADFNRAAQRPTYMQVDQDISFRQNPALLQQQMPPYMEPLAMPPAMDYNSTLHNPFASQRQPRFQQRDSRPPRIPRDYDTTYWQMINQAIQARAGNQNQWQPFFTNQPIQLPVYQTQYQQADYSAVPRNMRYPSRTPSPSSRDSTPDRNYGRNNRGWRSPRNQSPRGNRQYFYPRGQSPRPQPQLLALMPPQGPPIAVPLPQPVPAVPIQAPHQQAQQYYKQGSRPFIPFSRNNSPHQRGVTVPERYSFRQSNKQCLKCGGKSDMYGIIVFNQTHNDADCRVYQLFNKDKCNFCLSQGRTAFHFEKECKYIPDTNTKNSQ
jgi:hypothetical protein